VAALTGPGTGVEAAEAELWEGLAVRRGAAADPRAFDPCLGAVNRALLTRRGGYYLDRRRLPVVVVLFLLAASLLVGFLVGYTSELPPRNFVVLAGLFVLFVSATLYTIWDLDRPTQGLITADRTRLRDLSERLKGEAK
jgi:hypothetical protein